MAEKTPEQVAQERLDKQISDGIAAGIAVAMKQLTESQKDKNDSAIDDGISKGLEKIVSEKSGKRIRTPEEKAAKAARKAQSEADWGKKQKCKVHALSITDKKGTIFVAINSYTADIPQNKEIELPLPVIRFLKTAITLKHTVDGEKTVTEETPLYSVDITV